jgi:hypothetical protein
VAEYGCCSCLLGLWLRPARAMDHLDDVVVGGYPFAEAVLTIGRYP